MPMNRLFPSVIARLLMLTPPVAILVGAALVMLAGSGPSQGYVALAACGVLWLYRCFRVRVEWNEEGVRIANHLRSYSIRWDEVEDVEVGHTSSIAVRGIPFAVPKLLLTGRPGVTVVGALGVSRNDMSRFLSAVIGLTNGRAQGAGSFRSYSPWCQPSTLLT